ncbi:AAA family ATPase [Rosistilla oblonga]|uniref:phosphorylase family protein n=1 Tax=Rosistilla oblonga TaxID=2527990 RepID=UPI0011A41251|nr:AAA family ATPase [Rosistilla oblonga]
MKRRPLKLQTVQGNVDFAVITIRPDEYQAVLARIPSRQTVVGGAEIYEYAKFQNSFGELVRVAVARTAGQGHNAAQQTANDMFYDLRPKWIALVGIAGGFPNDDFSLGDVVLASRVLDLSVTASKKGDTEYAVHGGSCHPDVEVLLNWLPSQSNTLCEWCTPAKLSLARPSFPVPKSLDDERLYGNDDYKQDVADTLDRHFGISRAPLYAPAPLASSNMLVKDTKIVEQFKNVSRDIEQVEMEAGGVYRMCHSKQLPLLCVRGISDIVGFKRGPEWTLFACHSAASFFNSLLRLIPRDVWGKSLGAVGEVSHTNVPTVDELRQRIADHSRSVLRFQVPSENRIEFEVESKLKKLTEESQTKLLLGKAGSGKTCLLAKIGNEFLLGGYPVLAIKADMFPHDMSLEDWGRSELDCNLTFLEVVQAVSADETMVVIVDQLDALASVVDLTSTRLNELVSFITRCSDLKNVHVISSCRNFEFQYDLRFKHLNAKTFDLELPPWEKIAGILKSRGHDPDLMSEMLREELKVLQHLAVYLQLPNTNSDEGGQNA